MNSLPRMTPVRPWNGASGNYDVTDKLDGHRLCLRRGLAFRRAGARNEWHRLPPTIRERAPDEWLDGELMLPGEPAAKVGSALAHGGTGLEYRPFAFPELELSVAVERERIQDLGFTPPAFLGAYNATEIRGRWPAWSRQLQEGIVLRNHLGWFKLKRAATIELAVVDVSAGQGRLIGRIGALLCRLPGGGLVRIGMGLSDEDRARAADHVIGRLVEVAYQRRTRAGSLQHARFIRWRDDLRRCAG